LSCFFELIDPFAITGAKFMPVLSKVPFLGNIAATIRKSQRINRLKSLAHTRPLRIVIGASGEYEPGWIATDAEYLNLLNPQDWTTFFTPHSIDAMLAEHVWEHLKADDALIAAQHCFTYLASGGYLRIAVPDGFHPDSDYIHQVKPGGTGAGADDHQVLYTYQTLGRLLDRAGFRVEYLEYFDADGQFHFVDWNPEAGKVRRSRRFDSRNQNGTLAYTSLILDAHKD
jgi:predicted SAM-dependent methyltransferase